MSTLRDWIAGPAGPYLAILAMTVATYLCRAGGVVVMSRMRITPRLERGLRALPGSIVVATVLPLAVQGGLPAALGLVAALAAMAWLRTELAALAAGLVAVSLVRAAGF
ncbi:MAG TPA: AzlD domain-containing protein [Microvirga sp.]|jgi:uncharacterized membrane protein|nr:AzlD domain-containing protein [Microvirga sp.]